MKLVVPMCIRGLACLLAATLVAATAASTSAASSDPPASSDTSLSSVTVDGEASRGSAPRVYVVEYGVSRVTVAATATHASASAAITPPDADTGTEGHQVDVGPDDLYVTITVTAENGSAENHTLVIAREGRLASLTITGLPDWVDFTFDREIFDHSVNVPYSVEHLSMTGVPGPGTICEPGPGRVGDTCAISRDLRVGANLFSFGMAKAGYGWGRMYIIVVTREQQVQVPTDLQATATDRNVRLTWVAPHQPSRLYGNLSIDDMYLERASGDGDWHTVRWIPEWEVDWDTGAVSSVDWGLAADVDYRYRVRLEASIWDGSRWTRLADMYSQEIEVSTASDPPQAPVGLEAFTRDEGVALCWSIPQQPDWVDVFLVQVKRDTGGRYLNMVVDGPEWKRDQVDYEYLDSTAGPGQTHRYAVNIIVGRTAPDGYQLSTGEHLTIDTVSAGAQPEAGTGGKAGTVDDLVLGQRPKTSDETPDSKLCGKPSDKD